MPIPKEHLEFLKTWKFEPDADNTAKDGSITSFRNPDWQVHGVVKIYFKSHGYANLDGRTYMRHVGNPHVNLERAPQDYTVQISWGRLHGCGVSFLAPLKKDFERAEAA